MCFDLIGVHFIWFDFIWSEFNLIRLSRVVCFLFFVCFLLSDLVVAGLLRSAAVFCEHSQAAWEQWRFGPHQALAHRGRVRYFAFRFLILHADQIIALFRFEFGLSFVSFLGMFFLRSTARICFIFCTNQTPLRSSRLLLLLLRTTQNQNSSVSFVCISLCISKFVSWR